MAKQASRREFMIGAGVAAATGIVASKLPLAAQTGSQSLPVPANLKGGTSHLQGGPAGMLEVIHEHAAVVYHRDTGEIMHVHYSTTFKGGNVPTEDGLAEHALKYAAQAAEDHNRQAITGNRKGLMTQRDPDLMRVLHTHPDNIHRGPIRVDPLRGEIIPID